MEAGVKFLLVFLIVGSHGLSLNQIIEPLTDLYNGKDTKATIGEILEGPVCDFVNTTIPILPSYLQVFGDQPMVYNLTAIAGLLLNDSDLMSGQLTVSNIAIANLNEIVPQVCGLTTATSSSPLVGQLALQLPIMVEAKYIVNGILSSVSGPIPILGDGIFSVNLEINAALVTSIKFSPMFHALKMLEFNYTIDVPNVGLNLEGIDGDTEFVEGIERLFEGHILHGLSNLNENLHDDINAIIPAAINMYILNGITALQLIELIIEAGQTGTTTTSLP